MIQKITETQKTEEVNSQYEDEVIKSPDFQSEVDENLNINS